MEHDFFWPQTLRGCYASSAYGYGVSGHSTGDETDSQRTSHCAFPSTEWILPHPEWLPLPKSISWADTE